MQEPELFPYLSANKQGNIPSLQEGDTLGSIFDLVNRKIFWLMNKKDVSVKWAYPLAYLPFWEKLEAEAVFPVQKKVDLQGYREQLYVLLEGYALKHPWLKSEIEKKGLALYEECYEDSGYGRPSTFNMLLEQSIKQLDYVFTLPSDFRNRLTGGKKLATPERDRFFSDLAHLYPLKQSFLKTYTEKIIDEFVPFFACYQKESKSLELFSSFIGFLTKGLDNALSSLGEEFQGYVAEYCKNLLPQERKSDFSFCSMSIWSPAFANAEPPPASQEQKSKALLEHLRTSLDQDDEDTFFALVIKFLECNRYHIHSYPKIEKQLKKCYPDTFSKKILLTSFQKGKHLDLLPKWSASYAIEVHKILWWRMIVLVDKEGQLVIDSIHRQHDAYTKRLDVFW